MITDKQTIPMDW